MIDWESDPHRRYNPLTGDWIQVSPHRAKRPWQGKREKTVEERKPEYDPDCYLCPGNKRAGGIMNPNYESTFVFDNDFSALHLDTPSSTYNEEQLLIARGESGICRVVCFSPRHDLTLPELPESHIRSVVDTWVREYRELGSRNDINYVQVFENKGEMMGCSNPHPHCQIWAQQTVPDEPRKELERQQGYLEQHHHCLLCDYLSIEHKKKVRIILENEAFTAVVPFWAVWPFETMIIARRHFSRFTDLKEDEKDALADIIRKLTIRYDNLFEVSFPYSAGFHPAPTDGAEHPEWHFHMHFYPPLLRSATVKKFMVGYEMMANPQRDLTAETAAGRLRELSGIYYKQQHA